MSLTKTLKKLAVQHQELQEERKTIVETFGMSYQENIQNWKECEARKNLQTVLNRVKSGLKINKARSSYYKKLYRQSQNKNS